MYLSVCVVKPPWYDFFMDFEVDLVVQNTGIILKSLIIIIFYFKSLEM